MESKDFTLHKNFLNEQNCNLLYQYLLDNVDWTDKAKTTSGEIVDLNRWMAYISETPKEYFYANLSFTTKNGSWKEYEPLLVLKCNLIKKLGVPFNSVLLNYYENGKDSIRWHSDKELCLGEKPVIACLNLGATRKFWVQEKKPEGKRWFYELNNGDLLVMNENCQENFLHAILPEKDVKDGRISLTFRVCND